MKMNILFATLLCIFIVTLNALKLNSSSIEGKLINGRDDIKYTAMLRVNLCRVKMKKSHRGFGIFISPNKVLTAAAVVYSWTRDNQILSKESLRVAFWHYEEDEIFAFRVADIMIPPEYNHPSFYHNIAVLKLQNHRSLPYWEFPAVDHYINSITSKSILVGENHHSTECISAIIDDVEILHENQCRYAFNNEKHPIDPALNFCATPSAVQADRKFDLGTPLGEMRNIRGIFLDSKEGSRSPIVFTRLTAYEDFLNEALCK